MSYYLDPKSDIEPFECNIHGFLFLMEMLEIFGADMDEATLLNEGAEISECSAESWGELLSSRLGDLKVAEISAVGNVASTIIPMIRGWDEKEVRRWIEEWYGEGLSIWCVREPGSEELAMVNRYIEFLQNCKGFTQY